MENDRLFIKIAAIRCAFCYLPSLYAFNENEKEISNLTSSTIGTSNKVSILVLENIQCHMVHVIRCLLIIQEE